MTVLQEVRKYMLSKYGNLISAEEPKFNDVKKIWEVQLKSDYPRLIRDDIDPKRRMLKFITLKGLGELQLSEELKVIEATSREKCISNLGSYLRMWRERAERIVVATSSNQLARVSGASHMLNPILMIISNLLEKEIIQDWEIEDDSRTRNVRQYLKLLGELGLVKRKKDGWSYGNLFTALREQSKNNKDFGINVLSYIVKERYPIIREIFNISRFETFVHVDTCYYAPSLEAEKLLYREEESIYSDYLNLYPKTSLLRIRHILSELNAVGALERRDKYYYGNKGLFSDMLAMKNQLEEVTPPSAGS